MPALLGEHGPRLSSCLIARRRLFCLPRSFHADGRQLERGEWPLVRSVLNGVTVSNEEVAVEFGDGSRSVLRISSAPVRAGPEPDSPMIGAVAISVDITGERVQAEERLQVGRVGRGLEAVCLPSPHPPPAQLLSAERAATAANRHKGEFVANMSHELRTPSEWPRRGGKVVTLVNAPMLQRHCSSWYYWARRAPQPVNIPFDRRRDIASRGGRLCSGGVATHCRVCHGAAWILRVYPRLCAAAPVARI